MQLELFKKEPLRRLQTRNKPKRVFEKNDLVRVIAIGRVNKPFALFPGYYQVDFSGKLLNLSGSMLEKIKNPTYRR